MVSANVIESSEFGEWYDGLDDGHQRAVDLKVQMLRMAGVTLGHPHSSAINGAAFALRELRVQAKGAPLRVFYAFDPARNAVLLIGGDKTGDERFYEHMIAEATRIWKAYLASLTPTKGGKPR